MKKIFTTTLFALFITAFSFGQTLENGLSLYEQGDYERAIRVLSQSNNPEAILFVGKSYFALNNYIKAIHNLNRVPENAEEVYQEAMYTKALAHFQLDDFPNSLDVLKRLSLIQPSTSTVRASLVLYDKVLGYLTIKQRREVFQRSTDDQVRLDVLESLIHNVPYNTAVAFANLFERSATDINQLRFSRVQTMLSDSISYTQRFNPNQVIQAPSGISYNIGVVLPEFEYEALEYEIPQHLYFGIQLAIEDFNSSNADQKAFINYRNTIGTSAEEIINDLVWNEDVDVIIGPLFSNVAKEYSNLAEEYEVPMLLPLANADSLDLYNNFVFQLNPSFATQGKIMAEYAVNQLGYDTLGVIAEKGSLGAPAARSFMRHAERNGGFVEYYFVEDLEEFGYDIRDYTQFFTSDTLDSVDMVKAVYAPFTGTVASTLIESMLTDLEAMRSTVAILGSEEWSTANLEDRRLPDTELYFTESFNVDTSDTRTSTFASNFRLRFNTQPNQFAYIGYDAANVILETLLKVKNPAQLRDALKDLNGYEGLSNRVSFRSTHVNHEIRVRRMPRDSDLISEEEGEEIEGF